MFRFGKVGMRFETQTEPPKLVSDPTFEIVSPKSGPETRVDLNRIISDLKFSIKLLIFA